MGVRILLVGVSLALAACGARLVTEPSGEAATLATPPPGAPSSPVAAVSPIGTFGPAGTPMDVVPAATALRVLPTMTSMPTAMPASLTPEPTAIASATGRAVGPAVVVSPALRDTTTAPLLIPPTVTGVPAAAAPVSGALPVVIRIDGAFTRVAPTLGAGRSFPVFDANRLTAVGRTSDAAWVELRGPGGAQGWLLRDYIGGDGAISALPVVQAPVALPVRPVALDPSITIPPPAKARYRAAVASGRNPRTFTVVGACNSEAYAYVRRVATGLFDVSNLGDLRGAAEWFTPSFTRVSMAARGGYTAASLFDVDWVDPAVCAAGEGPLACELRQSRASIVIIEIGTGDQFVWRDFEGHFRAIVDYVLNAGALPVLVTKADDLDHQQGLAPEGFINGVIRRVAVEKGLPFVDFHAATRGLPNRGLIDEGNYDFHLNPAGSDLHLVLTLQALNALIQ